MKNLIVLVLLIFMPKCYLIGQNDLKFSASVSETVSFDFLKTGNVYLGANAQFGIQFKQLNTSVNYQFGGLYSYNWNDLFDYNFHLLGINCEYIFLSFAKKISPTLGTTLATQIGSNYLNGIFNDGYIPY